MLGYNRVLLAHPDDLNDLSQRLPLAHADEAIDTLAAEYGWHNSFRPLALPLVSATTSGDVGKMLSFLRQLQQFRSRAFLQLRSRLGPELCKAPFEAPRIRKSAVLVQPRSIYLGLQVVKMCDVGRYVTLLRSFL